MNILSAVIIVFLVLEILNVIILYFAPRNQRGNGLGVFRAYDKAKEDPEVFALVQYLTNWVAGSKIIFIALLVVIVLCGDRQTILYSVVALIISIATFFWRLYPAMRRLDAEQQLNPPGYSKTLGIMIACFLVVFFVALILFLRGDV